MNPGQPRLLRQVNLQMVTRRMRQMEVFSKIDLARQLGISTTTMTKLFAQLEKEQLIVPSALADSSFGRPKILYQLSPALQVAAVVIDVETTTLCLSGLHGDIQEKNVLRFPTGRKADMLFRNITDTFLRLRQERNGVCRLLGVCLPGLIETETGKSMLCPNLPWLEGIRPAARLAELLGLPCRVMHEEKALSRAQVRASGAAEDYITMDFSSGVGMSVVANGQALTGAAGFAGEIGHVIMQPGGRRCGCGNRGCLETIASDRALQSDTPRQVIGAQATGLAAVINIFNPRRIFVHSQLAETFPGYLDLLRKETRKRSIPLSFDSCSIDSTRDGKLSGAVLQTIDHLIEGATSA